MNINFSGEIKELISGIEIIKNELGICLSEDGFPVKVEKSSKNIEVIHQNGEAVIRYHNKIHFFRALGLLMEGFKCGDDFHFVEEPQFEMNGAMFDVSRNAVLRVESIKNLLRKMALMGLNMMMLYTEDTYTVKSRPYFGYMRGRYSHDELNECDDYADSLGIEMIPCIQCLGHLKEALKWKFGRTLMDTEDILLAGSDETYKFIEEMISAAIAPFRSKRIHIGMDEAHNLGLGKYLDMNGYTRRFDIMSKHLLKVVDVTSKYGLKPMIWSDMFFRLGSKTGDYYDKEVQIPEDVIKNIPEELQLVYWDYYHVNKEFYNTYIRKHKDLGSDPVFAGGIWTWQGMCTNYHITIVTTNAALESCKSEGVQEVFATIWGDNGAETNMFFGLLGLQLYAEHGYSKLLDMDRLKSRFRFCTGMDYEALMDISQMDQTQGAKAEDFFNPSKYILWQDILQGLFDKNIERHNMGEYYRQLANKLKGYISASGEWSSLFDFQHRLCSVLSLKSEMGIKLKKYYDARDKEGLAEIAEIQLPELYHRVKLLRAAHRTQWMKTNKPFGWDVLDIRYGGLLARIDTAMARVGEYLSGCIDTIEELEEERLYYNDNGPLGFEDNEMGCFKQYLRIASACPI